MSGPAGRPWGLLNVTADLEISVDGAVGHLSSDGDRLILSSAHPERLWAAATASALPSGIASVSGPRGIGELADELAGAGLRLEVTGPRGEVAVLGKGVRSRLGRALTGSSAVGPGAPGSLAALAWARLPRAATAGAVALGGVSLVAGALWLARRAGQKA